MEQKKTVWIIAAVGAFLLVVLGAAGILYSPAKNLTPTTTQTVATNTPTQNSGWTGNESTNNTVPVTSPNTNNGISSQTVKDMIVVSDNTTVYGLSETPHSPVSTPKETTIDLNALKNDLQANTTPVQPQNINITVNVPESEKGSNIGLSQNTTVQNVLPTPETTPVVTKTPEVAKNTQKVEKAEVSKPIVTAKEEKVSKPTSKPTSKPATTKTETKKPSPKPVEQYWVQVASYSNKKAAENARTILDTNKISSDIFTYEDKKDDLYFRVRVGPYMTESEAEYLKAKILKIPFFKDNDAYITKTTK